MSDLLELTSVDTKQVISDFQELKELQKEQLELAEEIITALGNTVEAKDRYTNGHSQRVASYAKMLAECLGWGERQCRHIYYTGLLHDIGKIRISDAIINKAGKLDENEYDNMKLHTLAGYYILKGIPSIAEFAIGARWHHERYDGKGYPNGLSGQNIPLVSRIISVADAYDAMTSNRSYRSIMPQAKVRGIIEECLGTQFDPDIGKIMLHLIDDDKEYCLRQPDPVTEYTILAIDDDSMSLKLLEFLLERNKNYRLITTLSGKEGITIALESHVDLVLLDVEMPELNGFDVLERIRENKLHLPVIFMTGEKDMDIIQKAEAMGVNDYLTKPLVAHILLESIQNVLFSKIY